MALQDPRGSNLAVRFYNHESAGRHDNGHGHPEAPVRIDAILTELQSNPLAETLVRCECPEASHEQLERVHGRSHVDHILSSVPSTGFVRLDADTSLSPASGEASLRAAGGACDAVDTVLTGEDRRAFVAMRPPGHHAEPDRAMGFCLFNSIAVAAMQARHVHGVDRIAIVDFDVHHGNGTQAAFWADPKTLYISTHQWPLYPGTGSPDETGEHDNIVNLPMPPGAGSVQFRRIVENTVVPRISEFGPELLLVSAGFDAHAADPLAQIGLSEHDFGWVTSRLVDLAETHSGGRVASVLEGGYHPAALARSVVAHLEALAGRRNW